MLKLTGIQKTFGKKDARVEALRGVDMEIHRGEMVAIMGKSGSGKSTLLNICGALMKPDQGEYRFDGKILDLDKQKILTKMRKDHIGFVVQYFALIEDMNVFENVALPLRYQKLHRREIRSRVTETLKLLEIEDKIKSYPDELSGGQQQRVAIARAMIKNPKLLLCDELTGALDTKSSGQVLKFVEKMNRKFGTTVVIITHNEAIAGMADQVVRLKDGRVCENRKNQQKIPAAELVL